MTIENLINLIDGKLISSPSIKKVEGATIFPSKVELGDLFFAIDEESAKKALQNGAYAIVFEGDLPIEENDVAYIKVTSLQEATIKFLRYIILQKKQKIFYMNEIESALLKQILLRKSKLFAIAPNNWQKRFELILNSNYEIIILNDLECAQKLTPQYLTLEKKCKGEIIDDSLLKTTFKLEKFIYQNIPIPPFYFEYLQKVTAFLKQFDTPYDINKIHYFNAFHPFYINNFLQALPKGKSDKVVIFTNHLPTINKALLYIKKSSKWTKAIVITPPEIKLEENLKPFWAKNNQEVQAILKREYFTFTFCYQFNAQEILDFEDFNYSLF